MSERTVHPDDHDAYAPTTNVPTNDASTNGAPTNDASTNGAPTNDPRTGVAPTDDVPTDVPMDAVSIEDDQRNELGKKSPMMAGTRPGDAPTENVLLNNMLMGNVPMNASMEVLTPAVAFQWATLLNV